MDTPVQKGDIHLPSSLAGLLDDNDGVLFGLHCISSFNHERSLHRLQVSLRCARGEMEACGAASPVV